MPDLLRLVEPLGLLAGDEAPTAVAAGLALPLFGGPVAFALARLLPGGEVVRAETVPAEWLGALSRLTAPRPAWAGLAQRPAVMGILNVTPDSFSDGGRHFDPARAVEAGLAMAEAGAALIDVGGESTRVGSRVVPPDEERGRMLPVVRALAAAGVVVSVDTRNAATMADCLDAGARIVNDVSALAHDPEAVRVVAEARCPVVLMHMRGTPQTMAGLGGYADVAVDVAAELAERVAVAERAGVAHEAVALDPGIGFAKNAGDSAALLGRLGTLLSLGFPLVVGVSRKSFIGALAGEGDPLERMPGSLAAGLAAVLRGAAVLRVHDVAATVQALRVWRALCA